MAATIARAQGYTKDGRCQASLASRLGHGAAWAAAATWRTLASVYVRADGSVEIEVRRDRKIELAWVLELEG